MTVPTAIHRAAVQACRSVMVPLAKFLLKNGIGYREFSEISRWAFVKVVAARDNKSGRPKVSRIAAATGLSRKDVTRVLQDLDSPDPPGMQSVSSGGRILEMWHRLPDYLDSSGKPAAIPIRGPKVSFSCLSRLADDSISVDHMLRELERAGSIERTTEGLVRARERYFVAPAGDPERVKRFGLRVRDLATTINYNNEHDRREARLFEASAICLRLDPKFLPLCKRMIADGGLQYLQQVDSWFASHEASNTEDSSHVARVGVGMYFFQEPTDTDADDPAEAAEVGDVMQ